MLTKNSYVALDNFMKSVKYIKGNNLKRLWTMFERVSIDYSIVRINDIQKKVSYQSLDSEIYIDENLKKEITILSNYREITIQSGKHRFNFHIYYDKKDKLDLLVDTLAYALVFTKELTDNQPRNITIKFYLLDTKRVFDGDSILDKEEVNGGACWSTPTDCDITIWRKEEIIKVAIHELIHGLSYDYKQDSSEIIQHYRNKYSISSEKMNTFEGYTEIFAELIHSYLLSRLINSLYPKLDGYLLFQTFVAIEIEFSKIQASKVLYLKDTNSDVNKHTNVAAYYLIKTELYNDLDNFLNYCIHHNKDIIKMKDTTKYFDYLKKLKAVDKKKMNVQSNYILNTTRMTCLELDLF